MYHGSNDGMGLDQLCGGFGPWRLVGFLVEISGFLGLDRCSMCGFVSSSDGGFDGDFFFLAWFELMLYGFFFFNCGFGFGLMV